jgi:hypothetical protein
MPYDLLQIRTLAEKKEDENWRFRRFLKDNSDREELDSRVFAITQRVWEGIDCTQCANCCREMQPTFSEEEVDRLARRLAITRETSSRHICNPRNQALTIPGGRAQLLAHS